MVRKVLVVDDDQKTRLLLKTYLEKNQFEVVLAGTGESFLGEFHRNVRELSMVILDVMLPDTDGFALCRTVREHSPDVAIIMLTASADETDRVVGLEVGADDYIAKPYSPRELLARMKAILRRSGREPTAATRYYRFDAFTLDLVERKVLDETGAEVQLTGLDFKLLKIFVERPGEVLDRDELSEQTRGRESGPLDRSLDVQISRLRMRLRDDGKQPRLIKTVRGSGYVFAAEVHGSPV
jgi:two-component system, OmpR family, response regulator